MCIHLIGCILDTALVMESLFFSAHSTQGTAAAASRAQTRTHKRVEGHSLQKVGKMPTFTFFSCLTFFMAWLLLL